MSSQRVHIYHMAGLWLPTMLPACPAASAVTHTVLVLSAALQSTLHAGHTSTTGWSVPCQGRVTARCTQAQAQWKSGQSWLVRSTERQRAASCSGVIRSMAMDKAGPGACQLAQGHYHSTTAAMFTQPRGRRQWSVAPAQDRQSIVCTLASQHEQS